LDGQRPLSFSVPAGFFPPLELFQAMLSEQFFETEWVPPGPEDSAHSLKDELWLAASAFLL
jgi:hypothetical protein